MGRNRSVAKVELSWSNGHRIGVQYFATLKDAKQFATVSRSHGKIAKVIRIKHGRKK